MDNWKGECAMATLQMYMNQSKIENMFTSEVYEEVWGKKFGVDNSVGKIRRILLHCPGEEIRQLKDGVYEEEAGARILKSPFITTDFPVSWIFRRTQRTRHWARAPKKCLP